MQEQSEKVQKPRASKIDQTIVKIESLSHLKAEYGFWFLDQLKRSQDPLVELVYGDPIQRFASLQYCIGSGRLEYPGLRPRDISLNYATWSADMRFEEKELRKMNEDALLIRNFGPGRLLVGVVDGASSRQPISGLEAHGVKGAWEVSHLTTLGFPTTQEFMHLQDNPNSTAFDFMVSVNTWLNGQMSQIQGVDYSNVLTIPGAAATFAICDFNKDKITIAHAADTLAIAEYTEHGKILTDDKNERFDRETYDLLHKIAKERHISNREASLDPRIAQQLAESYLKKINTIGGTSILNGMPELVSHDLIQTTEIDITPDLTKLHIMSDGIHKAWTGRVDLNPDLKTRKILGALDSSYYRPTDTLYHILTRLEQDPNHNAIERLGSFDDTTRVSITLNDPGETQFRIDNKDLLDSDFGEILSQK